jgi:hypothetical protein
MYSKLEIVGISDLLDCIESTEARQAFLLLITALSGAISVSATPGVHGFIKDFRVVQNSRNYFAFIPNKQWLLCYFRKPGFSDGMFQIDAILSHFPEAEKTKQGEMKLKVSDYETASRTAHYLSGCLGSPCGI